MHEISEDELRDVPNQYSDVSEVEVELEFIGQAWIDGYAREVDNSRTTFNIPLSALYDENTDSWPGLHDHSSWGYHLDEGGLMLHANAPELVRDWDGPCIMTVQNVSA